MRKYDKLSCHTVVVVNCCNVNRYQLILLLFFPNWKNTNFSLRKPNSLNHSRWNFDDSKILARLLCKISTICANARRKCATPTVGNYRFFSSGKIKSTLKKFRVDQLARVVPEHLFHVLSVVPSLVANSVPASVLQGQEAYRLIDADFIDWLIDRWFKFANRLWKIDCLFCLFICSWKLYIILILYLIYALSLFSKSENR